MTSDEKSKSRQKIAQITVFKKSKIQPDPKVQNLVEKVNDCCSKKKKKNLHVFVQRVRRFSFGNLLLHIVFERSASLTHNNFQLNVWMLLLCVSLRNLGFLSFFPCLWTSLCCLFWTALRIAGELFSSIFPKDFLLIYWSTFWTSILLAISIGSNVYDTMAQ